MMGEGVVLACLGQPSQETYGSSYVLPLNEIRLAERIRSYLY